MRTQFVVIVVVVTGIMLSSLPGCGEEEEVLSEDPADTGGAETVNDFLYQLQNLELAAIGNTAYDLVVMDYSLDGGESGEFSPSDIAMVKASGKVVLAYISVGEAGDFRYYWDSSWNDDPDPDPDAPA